VGWGQLLASKGDAFAWLRAIAKKEKANKDK
jgi:hypothetical protein